MYHITQNWLKNAPKAGAFNASVDSIYRLESNFLLLQSNLLLS